MLLHESPFEDECEIEDIGDPFGRSREELEYLDKADFDWKLEMEDRIGGRDEQLGHWILRTGSRTG